MRLFLLFLAIPLIEIALFVKVGQTIGLWWTLAIVVATALLGTTLLRAQGVIALARLDLALRELRNPTEELATGAMLLLAGVLLLTPGYFTDAVGLSLMVPAVRSWLYVQLRGRFVFGQVRTAQDFAHRTGRDEIILDAEYFEIHPEDAPGAAPRRKH